MNNETGYIELLNVCDTEGNDKANVLYPCATLVSFKRHWDYDSKIPSSRKFEIEHKTDGKLKFNNFDFYDSFKDYLSKIKDDLTLEEDATIDFLVNTTTEIEDKNSDEYYFKHEF